MDNSMFKDLSLEVKALEESGIFTGYASIFNIVDDTQDVIVPGAFKKNIQSKKVKLLWQHEYKRPIGKILDIHEDRYGLFIKAKLILDVQQGQEAYSLLKSEVINGLSIGYVPLEHKIDNSTGIRHITQLELWEVSLVTFPANRLSVIHDYKNTTWDHDLNQALQRALNSLIGRT